MQNDIFKWDFHPNKESEDPYEPIMPYLNEIFIDYNNKTEEEQNIILDMAVQKIRTINVFPIIYFNDNGISKEIQSVINKNDISFVEKGLYTQARNGNLLLDYMFPNLHKAFTCNINTCIYDRFFDDDILKKTLNTYFHKNDKILNMRTAFMSINRFYYDTPINFPSMRAKCIYEKFCPANGVIYDYSMGFGGRMLGALSSKQNFTYIGTDPNSETYYWLKNLGSYIEKETKRTNSYKIFNLPSEQLCLDDNSVDLAFSSPPFYNKEIYTLEENQSIMKYPKYEDWLEKYVRPTIQNCYKCLKEDGVFIFDLVNYTLYGHKIPLVEDWIKISKEEGFVFKQSFDIGSRFRKKEQEGEKIYVFKKNDNPIIDYTPSNIYNIAEQHRFELERAKRRRFNFTIVEYDIFGNFINSFNSFEEANIDKQVVKNQKILYNNKYYRIYRDDEKILTKIKIKQPIAYCENKYFYTFSELGRYLGVSRQAVQQSYKRQSKMVNHKDIIWYNKENI